MWSRVANKVYLVLAQHKITDFESYFQLISGINRSSYVSPGQTIDTFADSYQSTLHHTPSLQSLAKKAIIRKLTQSDNETRLEHQTLESLEVQIFVFQDQCYICLNTSGEALYKRWYRIETGDAPLKENIAAALVLISNWTYHLPFVDPCCGSGTICIEAAMIAKQRAPWLDRKFAFESRDRYDHNIIQHIRQKAQDRQISKPHTLIGSDSDSNVLAKARANMLHLGLGDIIVWKEASCQSYQDTTMEGTMITNPPYGQRMHVDDIDEIHKNLAHIYKKNIKLGGWCITGYIDAWYYFDSLVFNTKNLYNGAQDVIWYQKKIQDLDHTTHR